MRVDIWSDVIRPGCYVGKARLAKAPSTFAHSGEVEGVCHSLGLGPDSPRGTGESSLFLHRILHLGLHRGVQRELPGAVSEAPFTQARDVSGRPVLTEVAAGAGLDADEAGKVFDAGGYAGEFRQDERQAWERQA